MIEFVKHIEYNFVGLKLPNIREFRNKIFPLIKGIKQAYANRIDIEKRIFSLIKTAKSFVKNNPHILFTRTDKSNVVVLDKTEYVQKMETLLSDTETYKLLTYNPVNKMLTQLKTF